MEPFYIAQITGPKTAEERTAWFRARADEARAQGAKWGRFSVHATKENLLLVEAWKARPQDEGDQRWRLEG